MVNLSQYFIYKFFALPRLTATGVGHDSCHENFAANVTAACLRAGRAGFGPTLEMVHPGRDSAQLGLIKVIMGKQMRVAWFDSARPKVPMEKPY